MRHNRHQPPLASPRRAAAVPRQLYATYSPVSTPISSSCLSTASTWSRSRARRIARTPERCLSKQLQRGGKVALERTPAAHSSRMRATSGQPHVLREEQDVRSRGSTLSTIAYSSQSTFILEECGEQADCHRPHQRKRKPHALPSNRREGLKAKDIDIVGRRQQGVRHARDGDDEKIPHTTKPNRPIRERYAYISK